MDRNQVNTVMGAFFHLLLFFCTFMNRVSEFQQQEMHDHIMHQRVTKRKRNDDELAIASMVLQGFEYKFRRFWVDARSSHWISHVMDGVLLQEEQFMKKFRMNRNSFNALHGLLGMYRIQV